MQRGVGRAATGCHTVLALGIALLGRVAEAQPVQDPYALLGTIRTPQELVSPHFPPRYRVEVALGGDVAAELHRTLSAMGLSTPRYEEVMTRTGEFRLEFNNDSWSLETKELLSGFLNPVEIMQLAITGLLRYRDDKGFAQLKEETRATVTLEERNGAAQYRIHLSPRGNRFGYEHTDYGTFMQERWLGAMTIEVDTLRRLVTEIEQMRLSRTTTVAQSTPPVTDTALIRYRTTYGDSAAGSLPLQLVTEVNGTRAMTITAAYRTQGDYTVFDHRSICYESRPGRTGCLTMRFGTYTFDARYVTRRSPPATRGAPRSRKLEAAARLSQRASQHLRKGDIAAAARLFDRLAREYPDTPQGVEAQTLIETLPSGF